MHSHRYLLLGCGVLFLLFNVGVSYAPADTKKLEQEIEERRVAIEKDRKALNADCGHVSSADTTRMADCKVRHEDVVRRMAQYKQDLSKQSCESLSASIAHFEDGIGRIGIVMDKNEKFIKEAEDAKKAAVGDAAATAGEVALGKGVDALQDRIANFVKAKESLLKMKKGLDEAEKFIGVRERARKLSPGQIKQARKWIDNGLKYGGDVADLGVMVDQYNKAGSTQDPNSPMGKKILSALNNFNDKFMNDAGGWEFAGEHLAEFGGGPAGELAFKTAVIGIKVQVAAASYLINDAQLAEYRANQEKMKLELIKTQQKVKELKESFEWKKCLGG